MLCFFDFQSSPGFDQFLNNVSFHFLDIQFFYGFIFCFSSIYQIFYHFSIINQILGLFGNLESFKIFFNHLESFPDLISYFSRNNERWCFQFWEKNSSETSHYYFFLTCSTCFRFNFKNQSPTIRQINIQSVSIHSSVQFFNFSFSSKLSFLIGCSSNNFIDFLTLFLRCFFPPLIKNPLSFFLFFLSHHVSNILSSILKTFRLNVHAEHKRGYVHDGRTIRTFRGGFSH